MQKMEINELLNGIRSSDDNAVRELIRSRGAEVLAHAMALLDGDKTAAHTATAEAFRNAIKHLRAFPEEAFDDTALHARIDAELFEAVRSMEGKSVSEILSHAGGQTLSNKPEGDTRSKSAAKRKGKKARSAVTFVLLILCIAAALWLLYGILASMGWLPYADLGYTWFNRTVYLVF